MFCCLCTQKTENGFEIFGLQGKEQQMRETIERHFWLKLNENNAHFSCICSLCWSIVKDFHAFYEQVERSHSLYFDIKEEEIQVDSSAILTGRENAIKLESEMLVENANHEEIAEEPCEFDPLLNPSKTEDSEQEEETEKSDKESETDTEDEHQEHKNENQYSSDSDESFKGPKPTRTRRSGYDNVKLQHTEKQNTDLDLKIAQVVELSCDVCQFKEPNYRRLMQHMKDTHNIKGYTVCCSKKFVRRSHLLNHIERHINPDYCKCQHCGKNLANKQCLEQHIFRRHPPEEERIYACPQCNKKFSKQFILERHQIIHAEKTHICETCNKRFHTLQKLKTHIKTVHNSGGHMCEICAKVILCRVAFKRHCMKHIGAETPRVQCNVCKNWYKDDYALSLHKRNHDQASTVHKCEICGKVSASRRALLCHMNYVHMAERKFECNVCHKSFKKAINLREHMTLHTGEVLYKCPHCPRTFNSNSNMYSHRKKVHPEEFEEARRDRTVHGITEENRVLKYTS